MGSAGAAAFGLYQHNENIKAEKTAAELREKEAKKKKEAEEKKKAEEKAKVEAEKKAAEEAALAEQQNNTQPTTTTQPARSTTTTAQPKQPTAKELHEQNRVRCMAVWDEWSNGGKATEASRAASAAAYEQVPDPSPDSEAQIRALINKYTTEARAKYLRENGCS